MTGYDMADAMRNVITEQREEITALKAENAKLRELVRNMFDGMCDHDFDICCICPHWQEGYNGCEYHARMRGLGIEVE